MENRIVVWGHCETKLGIAKTSQSFASGDGGQTSREETFTSGDRGQNSRNEMFARGDRIE